MLKKFNDKAREWVQTHPKMSNAALAALILFLALSAAMTGSAWGRMALGEDVNARRKARQAEAAPYAARILVEPAAVKRLVNPGTPGWLLWARRMPRVAVERGVTRVYNWDGDPVAHAKDGAWVAGPGPTSITP